MNRVLGALSLLGSPRNLPPGSVRDRLLRRSRLERTYPVVCRNLGLPCELSTSILGAQLLARSQAEEIGRTLDVVPLKGLDLAWHEYPSPDLRDMGDLDLLVRGSELTRADGVLRSLGYVPEQAPEELSTGTLRAALYEREGCLPVHLHWHLLNSSWPQFMFRVDMDEVWAAVRGGRLSPAHRFVSLCEHALKHSYAELIHLTDLDLVSRHLDWAEVGEVAARWGLTHAVVYSLLLLRSLTGRESEGLRHFRASSLPWEGRLFLSLARRHRWDGLSGLGLLALARGRQLRFVREVFSPPEEAGRGYRSKTVGKRLLRAAGLLWRGITSPRGPCPAR